MLILLAAAVLQNPLGPMIPPGANEEFIRSCLSVEEHLSRSEFAQAERALAALPRTSIRIEWDDSKLPEARRPEFADARDVAFKEWGTYLSGFKWELGSPADIKISFQEALPVPAGETVPAGAVLFVSDAQNEPRIESVISIKRGGSGTPAEWLDVHNEVGYAIASYYGLTKSPFYESFSHRVDLPNRVHNRPKPAEIALARRNLDVVDELKRLIEAKQPVTPARPRLVFDPPKIEGGQFVQGDVATYTIQLTNIGNAPLRISAVPDCGCVFPSAPPVLDVGQTHLMRVVVDTTEFVGQLNKNLILFSNDVEGIARKIPISLYAKPLFRLIAPEGNTAVVGESGVKHEVYLAVDPGTRLKPVEAHVDGVPAKVVFEPWSGKLADPEIGEGEKQRSGYKFTVTYGKDMPPGLVFSTLMIQTNALDVLKTNGTKFETLRQPIAVQRGIIAMPESLFFGEIARSPKRMFFLVTRPGKPFEITKIESDDPAFKFDWPKGDLNSEYRVTVEFDGKAEFGLLQTTFRVHTTDKGQPTVLVPFRAVVR